MRFFPLLLAALPLVAPFVAAAPSGQGLAARTGSKYCTKSEHCGDTSKFFCNRKACDSKKWEGAACYKHNGVRSDRAASLVLSSSAPSAVRVERV